jgi:16S rRNA (uracil1498-N3)-methyltransferase
MNQAKPKIRLYVPHAFAPAQSLALDAGQAHYIANVMRGKPGQPVAVFNGSDGEWLAEIAHADKKSVTLALKHRLSPQRNSPDLWLAFAPIKNKTDLVVEKAVELGVTALLPVFTRYAVVRSVNHDKLMAHAIEAAEQCERHDIPRLQEYKDLPTLLAGWPEDRLLLYGDETGGGTPLKTLLPTLSHKKYALLIGPEGGFSGEEHYMLKASPMVAPFGLGPRILRADTAAVAALACMQMWLGDWNEQPHFTAMEP